MNIIWTLNIPPKVKIFSWLLVRKKLRTKDKILKYQSHIDASCPFCCSHIETIDHLFCECSFAHDIWRIVCPPHVDVCQEGIIPWISKMLTDKAHGKDNLTYFLLICWQIWDARNSWIFKKSPPSSSKVIHVAQAIGRDFAIANPKKDTSKRIKESNIKWKPPDQDFFKLNFDGSVITNHSAAIGFIIRDIDGCPIVACAKKATSFHVPTTEAIALREGLCLARQRNFSKIQVEGDSKLIIDCVLNKCSVPWRLKVLVKDIQLLASHFQNIQFTHILREANFTADAIANLGHCSLSCNLWERQLPLSVLPAFNFDSSNFGCCRGFRL